MFIISIYILLLLLLLLMLLLLLLFFLFLLPLLLCACVRFGIDMLPILWRGLGHHARGPQLGMPWEVWPKFLRYDIDIYMTYIYTHIVYIYIYLHMHIFTYIYTCTYTCYFLLLLLLLLFIYYYFYTHIKSSQLHISLQTIVLKASWRDQPWLHQGYATQSDLKNLTVLHPYVFLCLRLRRLRIRGSTVEHGDFFAKKLG